MHIFSQTRSQARTVKPGSHGREIRAVSSSGRFTATAAEDTVIRIHEYVPTLPLTVGGDKTPARKSGGVFRCVASIEKHATGIQAVRWHRNEYLFSSGGNEEFFVWRVNRIDSDVCPLGIACEAVFQDKSEVGDLRIMDFDIEPLGGETQQFRFCITMALSNSAIQSYVYSRDEGFRLLGRRHYTGACLMQLRHLGGFSDHGDHTAQPHVLTAATDGHLAVFVGLQSDLAIEPAKLDEAASGDLPKKDVPEQANGQGTLITKLHQSGIKSLDMLEHYTSSSIEASTGSRSYLVVTGGDDNAIGVLHLCSTAATGAATTSYTVRSKSIVRSAHAAAVTGIGIARLERGGRDAVVVSTGNDQRVKTWRVVNWQQQQNQSQAASTDTVTRVELVADEYSGVADAGDLEIMRADEGSGGRDDGEASGDGKFLVGGVGMEVWRV
ncbi:hypothetical protein Micbo1qcDRAFT_162976 [Microdochium bolleyi]|uniref:WD40-repeat-containing domain protein n=1 Tax=Microdochium bolleyi TaxID=196109 RepID=A0A136J2C4_9PEZI|nr:hypothetical protein Micbo1qcDRAFT_162976 [Microdochium bolleyi]